MSSNWPSYRKASDLVGSVVPVSEEVLLQTARKHDIGRKLGRTVIFSPEDLTKLYEALPCHSNSHAAQNRPIGSCAAPSAESALRSLRARLTRKPPKKSVRSAKLQSSNSQSTVA